MRQFISIFFCLFISHAQADPVLIGMHYGQSYLRATVKISRGGYTVYTDEKKLFDVGSEQSFDITASGGEVNIFYNGCNYDNNEKVYVRSSSPSEFKVQPAGQKMTGRIYQENLIAFEYQGRLQLVNEIELERYVSGVIEAESGKGHELEYYKVQSVISRTYALNNLTRHVAEGFQLCDATHCQVFHGKPVSEPLAAISASATRDIVIVDADINLITAAFHSNCGGRTTNAEDVWSKPLSYCVSTPDTFCLHMPHSNWEKTITKDRWFNYLDSKRNEFSDTTIDPMFEGHLNRGLYYSADSTLKIPLRMMREDLKLRSTSFRMTPFGDEIVFVGSGFGHGVGLCQEGAMRMAQLDYCYEDIIHFYYKDVHLIPRYMMWFFKD